MQFRSYVEQNEAGLGAEFIQQFGSQEILAIQCSASELLEFCRRVLRVQLKDQQAFQAKLGDTLNLPQLVRAIQSSLEDGDAEFLQRIKYDTEQDRKSEGESEHYEKKQMNQESLEFDQPSQEDIQPNRRDKRNNLVAKMEEMGTQQNETNRLDRDQKQSKELNFQQDQEAQQEIGKSPKLRHKVSRQKFQFKLIQNKGKRGHEHEERGHQLQPEREHEREPEYEREHGHGHGHIPPLPPTKHFQVTSVEKRLLNIFQFYCRTILNAGVNPTFDKIKSQCQTLNQAKLLIFCNAFQLHSQKVTSGVVRKLFKKASGNLPEINFEQFKVLIKLIAETQFEGQAAAQSKLLQKLDLHDQEKYRAKLKALRIPVTTNKMNVQDMDHHRKMLQIILKRKKEHEQPTGKIRDKRNSQDLKNEAEWQRQKASKSNHSLAKLGKGSKPRSRQHQRGLKANSGAKSASSQQNLQFFKKLVNMDEEDNFYMREYKVERRLQGNEAVSSKDKKGRLIAQDAKKRAREEQNRQRQLLKKLK